MVMNFGKIHRWGVAVLSLASVFCAGLHHADGAVIERVYDFSLGVGFESSTHNTDIMGGTVDLTDGRSTSVEIDPFNTALGDLELVTITFSTTEFSYDISLTNSGGVFWGVVVERKLFATSSDSRVVLPDEATNQVLGEYGEKRTWSENINGAPVSFVLSLSDSESLDVFKEGLFQLQIGSWVEFHSPLAPSGSKPGKGTVSSSGNYAGTVTVTYQYAIPEPSAVLLLGSGPLALLALRAMRRARTL